MQDEWDIVEPLAQITEGNSTRYASVLNRVSKIGHKDQLEWRFLDMDGTGKPKRIIFSENVARKLNDALTEYLNGKEN